ERSLSLLHGVHARVAAALPRTRGGRRRRQPTRVEPVLARRPGALRPGRRTALDAPASAFGADLAARGRTDGARTAASAGGARRARCRGGAGTGPRERLGAEARARAGRLPTPD